MITRYPRVGVILNEFEIGCVACSVGTCQVKDVVGIHGLSPEREAALFTKIRDVVSPGSSAPIPAIPRKAAAQPAGAHRFSPPMQELVDEHKLIKRAIALIPALASRLQAGIDDHGRQLVARVIDFIRHYADRYHHAKEEDILFKYFDEKSDVLQAMHADHETGRGHVRAAEAAAARGDATDARERLLAYGALLTEHIRKEDEILYPWMDREMDDSTIGRLFGQFRQVDERYGDKPAYYRNLVESLEMELGKRKAEQ